MKLKLKNPDAPSAAPAVPSSNAAPTPSTAKPGLKIKLKPAAPPPADTADGQHGDTQKAKRKYTKKPKASEGGGAGPPAKSGTKKRARDDGDDVDSPATKRKPKPTQKSLQATATDSDDDDDNDHIIAAPAPPPRPLATRTPSLKLSIKPGGTNALQRTGTAILKVKGAGKPPVRPFGVGYDSEAEEAEGDPAQESQFILRMLPGSDCDLLRKAIEEKKIGHSVANGGLGVNFRFFDREGRRAMVIIQGRIYAASMVELPAVIESMKSWNKKDWVKTADVCQMLLVLGRVQNEDEAKKYPRPHYVDPDSHRFPHGLTPPMRWARKRRFRPRKSYIDVERAEAEMNRLLAEDDRAGSTKYATVSTDSESSDDGSSEDELGQNGEMANVGQMEDVIEEVDAGDLEQMLHAGFMEDEEMEITGNTQDLNAMFGGSDMTIQIETPTTAHEVAMHALSQNGNITLEPETAASTPAAATSADDDDDDDDGDSDDDVDEVDEAAAAEEQRQEQLRAEIAELEKAITQSVEQRDRQTNGIFKKRMQNTIDKQKADLAIKQAMLNEEADE